MLFKAHARVNPAKVTLDNSRNSFAGAVKILEETDELIPASVKHKNGRIAWSGCGRELETLMSEDIIGIQEAIRIYRLITGRKISRKYFEEQLHRFRHLGVFGFASRGRDPKLIGVRRHAWEYFIKTRMVLNGVRQIFHDHDE